MQVNGNRESSAFWIILVVLAIVLIIGGLLVIITGIGPEAGSPATISFLGAKFEGNDVGLAVIFLGLLVVVLAYKERKDIRKYKRLRSEYKGLRTEINGATKVAGQLVVKYGEQRLADRPGVSDEKTNRLKELVKKAKEEAEKGALDLVRIKTAQNIMDLSEEIDKESSGRP